MSLLTVPQPFFNIDSDTKWPELSSCQGELGSCGELVVRSEEGRAVFILGPSGQDFSVEYTCCLSSNQTQTTQDGSTEAENKAVNDLMCQGAPAAAQDTNHGQLKSLSTMTSTVQPKVRVQKLSL